MENNIKFSKRGEPFIKFMKKYGYYIIAAAIIVAITLTIVFTTSKGSELNIDDTPITPPTEEVDAYALKLDLPLSECSVLKAYSADKLIYNDSLGWFETHHGVDLISTKSSDVLAAAEGKVIEVYTNDLEGTVVVIQHNEVYTSKYGSLNSDVTVKVGDNVKRGQKIGTTSATAKNEVNSGAHLHFELYVDETEVNPADYLNIEGK